MGVYIKGWKMPNKCIYCFFNDIGTECGLLEHDVEDAILHGTRYGGCPLLPVPDHGDLIDRDALMSHKGSAYDIDGHELYAVGTGTILRMPVIIPAERSEE